ncbi:MAG: hypothetical protein DWI22_03835 [Planctomycetota bacterium]|nr:MAG: hypothetical protein DWI22_03835 [Planctomycetota bacterium]
MWAVPRSVKCAAEQFAIRRQQGRPENVWKAATADIRGQNEFTFELPAVEFCNSERPSGDKFQGENSATSTGALPPVFAHASKYQFSQIRGLIV